MSIVINDETVSQWSEVLQNAAAGVIIDYKGITVAEDTVLRAECRKNDVEYAVVKNTLLRFAFKNVGLSDLDDQLNGTTSLAISSDPVAPARVIADYAKKLGDRFEIKGKGELAKWNQDLRSVTCDCTTMCAFLMDMAVEE